MFGGPHFDCTRCDEAGVIMRSGVRRKRTTQLAPGPLGACAASGNSILDTIMSILDVALSGVGRASEYVFQNLVLLEMIVSISGSHLEMLAP